MIVENNRMKFWIEDDIMFSSFKKEINIDLEVAKEMIQIRHEISSEKKQYWCFDFKNLKKYTKEARDYAENKGQEYLYATAVIINSHLAKFILNTFMKLKKAEIPLKAFKTKEEAVSWLQELKKSNEEKGIY